MRMESYSTRSSNRGWLILAGILVIAGLVYAFFLRGNDSDADPNATPAAQAKQDAPNPQHTGQQNESQDPARHDASQDNPSSAAPDYAFNRMDGMTPELAAGIGPSPITLQPISDADAQEAFQQGLDAYRQDKLLEARALLNRAYTYGTLPPAQGQQARELLTDLANRTVLRADPYVNPKDPYLESYTFEMGDTLISRRDRNHNITRLGVIAKLDLNTPDEIQTMANGLQKGTQYKAGKAYKMIRGPFHLVVDLSEFAADLYVQDLFLRRMPVCIGAVETPTPTGVFRIPLGGKTPMSAYNAPVESGLPNVSILPGEPDYPLGPRGLNIKLEGIRPLGTDITVNQSYAIHGTNEPASIGTAASRGCVRMRAEDIHLVYACLMDYADPANPKVNWNRYSTVVIKK